MTETQEEDAVKAADVVLVTTAMCCGLVLISASWTYDHFFDGHVASAPATRTRRQPNAILFGRDVGMCVAYFVQFVVTMYGLASSSRYVLGNVTLMFCFLGIAVSTYSGYRLRAKKIESRLAAMNDTCRPGRLSTCALAPEDVTLLQQVVNPNADSGKDTSGPKGQMSDLESPLIRGELWM